MKCAGGGTGIRARLRGVFLHRIGGSNPPLRTSQIVCEIFEAGSKAAACFAWGFERRSHVPKVIGTGEPGSWNFAHDGVQNIPDHK